MHKVIFTLMVALAGGFVGHYLKFPASEMVGAMVFVGTMNIFGTEPQMPESLNLVAQIVIGGFLGLGITSDVLAELKHYVIPSLLVVVILAIFGILTGFIVNILTGIDLYTSLFGSVPGGMQEMVVLSQSYNVNHAAVMTIQTVRRVLIVVIYPLLLVLVSKLTKSQIKLPGKY